MVVYKNTLYNNTLLYTLHIRGGREQDFKSNQIQSNIKLEKNNQINLNSNILLAKLNLFNSNSIFV